MRKGVVLAFLAGWALAIIISPRNVIEMFKPRAA